LFRRGRARRRRGRRLCRRNESQPIRFFLRDLTGLCAAPLGSLTCDFRSGFASRNRFDVRQLRNTEHAAGAQTIDVAVERRRVGAEQRDHRAIDLAA
jgi:hypothetical protein